MTHKLKQLFAHQGFLRYFKNTSWLFGEKILRMIVGLFVAIWVARYLGPDRFGLLSYAQSFVGLFSAIAALGLDGIVVRELVKHSSRRDKLIGTAFGLKAISAVIVLVLLAVVVNVTSNDQYTNFLVFIIASATIFQSFNVIDFYFKSAVMGKYIAYANSVALLLSSFLKIVLILLGASLEYFALAILFDSVVLAFGLIFFYVQRRGLKIFLWKFDKDVARDLLRDSWPLILSGMVMSVYMKIDQIMLKEMIGSAAVGQYAAAVRISEAWYFIPAVVVSSLFPAIVNAKKVDQKIYYFRLQRLYSLMIWLSLIVALPMTFLSGWLINLLYGASYWQAGEVLAIHIWTSVFVFLGVAYSNYLMVENLTRKSFYRASAGAISNVVLNYFMIPIYGIYGAAISTLVAQFIVSYGYDFFDSDMRDQLKMKTKSFLLPIVLILDRKRIV